MSFTYLPLLRELILPPASLLIVLAAGIVVYRFRPRAGRILVGVSTALLFLFSSGYGANALVAPLEARAPVLHNVRESAAQAIVVLAAGRVGNAPEYGGAEQPDYIALARLRYAARLHRQTGLPVLASGGNGTPDGRYQPKAQAMERALREEFAVPVRWQETASRNTEENAEFSANILKRENIRRVLLVTDAMHMPRAVQSFERHGMEVIPAPTVFFSREPRTLMHLLPTAENLRRSYYALYEWIGLAWYALWYSAERGGKVELSPPT